MLVKLLISNKDLFSEPKGDQPQAIDELVEGLKRHDRTQVLLGVTGSGKIDVKASSDLTLKGSQVKAN